jgi:proteasome assembly chaperone (PAC2) family protein
VAYSLASIPRDGKLKNGKSKGIPMDGLIFHEVPVPKLPTMVVAFAGWPDAAEAATNAVRHLVQKLPAKKFAEIDPEEFYDFTVVRPQTRVNEMGEREIHWPANDFYYYAPEKESQGLALYIGTEPSLRWRAFSNIMLNVAEQCRVEFVVSLGALLDAVPHTREPQITGRASPPELAQKVEWLGIRGSSYQGPTGIHTAFMDACIKKDLSHASLWGHSPHYVTVSPNPKVTYALLTRLRSLVNFDVDLEELRKAGEVYETEVSQAIAQQADVMTYVKRLEQRYDAADAQTSDIPSPDSMVQELEEFLRSQRPPAD